MNENQQIAAQILKQLGGSGRLKAMTAAKNFVAVEKGLMFRFAGPAGRPNSLTIKLTGADEYDMVFHRIHGSKCAVTNQFAGVGAEQLADLFEVTTGPDPLNGA